MPLKQEDFENIIQERFQDVKFILTDTAEDGDHYSLEISSPEFDGLSLINSHRLINERLKDCIGTKVHALSITSINK
jgi:stress-induced morphogen